MSGTLLGGSSTGAGGLSSSSRHGMWRGPRWSRWRGRLVMPRPCLDSRPTFALRSRPCQTTISARPVGKPPCSPSASRSTHGAGTSCSHDRGGGHAGCNRAAEPGHHAAPGPAAPGDRSEGAGRDVARRRGRWRTTAPCAATIRMVDVLPHPGMLPVEAAFRRAGSAAGGVSRVDAGGGVRGHRLPDRPGPPGRGAGEALPGRHGRRGAVSVEVCHVRARAGGGGADRYTGRAAGAAAGAGVRVLAGLTYSAAASQGTPKPVVTPA